MSDYFSRDWRILLTSILELGLGGPATVWECWEDMSC